MGINKLEVALWAAQRLSYVLTLTCPAGKTHARKRVEHRAHGSGALALKGVSMAAATNGGYWRLQAVREPRRSERAIWPARYDVVGKRCRGFARVERPRDRAVQPGAGTNIRQVACHSPPHNPRATATMAQVSRSQYAFEGPIKIAGIGGVEPDPQQDEAHVQVLMLGVGAPQLAKRTMDAQVQRQRESIAQLALLGFKLLRMKRIV